MLDIPQAASTAASSSGKTQNKENLEKGPSTSEPTKERVFELSSKIQKFEISEKNNIPSSSELQGASSLSGALMPPRRAMKNQVGCLPPVDN